jgi:hypothetical protein
MKQELTYVKEWRGSRSDFLRGIHLEEMKTNEKSR